MSYSELDTLNKSWITVTENGVKFFQRKEFSSAKPWFEQAMHIGELLFRHAQDADRCGISVVPAFYVSCNNLAKNFQEMEDVKTAGDYFFYKVWNLKQLSLRKDISSTLQMETVKEWEKAVAALEEFHEQTGQTLTVNFRNEETYEQIGLAKRRLIFNKTLLN